MDTRWIQRFNNLNKAIVSLSVSLLEDTSNNITLRAGVIQFFEMTFELAWKTLKDYLNEIGYDEVNSPRSAIKKAFEIGIIDDGHHASLHYFSSFMFLITRSLFTIPYSLFPFPALASLITKKSLSLQ